jgi:ABC-type nitrate/sulfonate/bicarbonate transport system permease component
VDGAVSTTSTEPPRVDPAAGTTEGPRVVRVLLSRRQRLLRGAAPALRLRQLALLLVLLAVWEVLGERSDPFTFAPPSSVVSAGADMIASGELPRAALSSLVALLLGFGAAAAFSVAMGVAMGASRELGRTLDPYVAALYVVPVASLVPVIIAWLGLGMGARVFVIFLFSVFEPLVSISAGVRHIDPKLYDAARTMGARPADLLRRVTFPAALPFVFVGLRIAAARALKGMVLAEMLFAITGLGGLIITSAQDFRIDRVLAVVVTVSLMGVLLSAAVQGAERYVMRWRQA